MDYAEGYTFPMFLETKRMAPGIANSWYIEGEGLADSARFSTRDPKSFFYLLSGEKEQPWCRLDIGYSPAAPAFLLELDLRTPPRL